MNITEIKIRKTYTQGRFRALVSITMDGDLAIHDIKVIEGPERFFVAMPSRREENGVFRDVVHPITSEARQEMEQTILDAYYKHIEEEKENINNPFAYDEDIVDDDDIGI